MGGKLFTTDIKPNVSRWRQRPRCLYRQRNGQLKEHHMADSYTWNNPNSLERKAIEQFLTMAAQRVEAQEGSLGVPEGSGVISRLRGLLDLRPSQVDPLLICVALRIGETLYGHCTPVDTPNTWAIAMTAAEAAIAAVRAATTPT